MRQKTFEVDVPRLSSRGAAQVLEIGLQVNGRLFRNAAKGVTAEDFAARLSDETNSMQWIAGHLTRMREHMAHLAGVSTDDLGMLAFDEPFDPSARYPDREEILIAWDAATRVLRERLDDVTAAELARPAPIAFPLREQTIGGGLAFFVQHEGHHVGQLALLRRMLGYEAARYD